MSTDIISVIWEAIRDITKHYFQTRINTGDNVLNNLLNSLVVSISIFLFAMFTPKEMFMRWKLNLKRIKGKVPEEYRDAYLALVKSSIATFQQVVLSDKRVAEMFAKNIDTLVRKRPLITIENSHAKIISDVDPSKSTLEILTTMLSSAFIPIYVNGTETIAISAENGTLILAYNSEPLFNEFIAKYTVEEKQVFEQTTSKAVQKLFRIPDGEPILISYQNQRKGSVFPDRTFDKFVSRHKSMLMEYLRNFEIANTSGSLFGGFGTYNLGILIYGKPGTGKTHFMKVVANYFRRPIELIDMRLMKTRKQFEAQFLNHKNVIYVLDEFDCISGILQSRDSKSEFVSQSVKIEELRARYLQVLSLNSEKTPSVQQELDSIKSQISEVENMLTLESVLTVMDGMDEMRGRIILAATNHIERIDSAILREGRFDVKLEFTDFNEDETRELLTLMFKEMATPEEMHRLQTCRLISDKYSPAKLINLATCKRTLTKVLNELEVVSSKKTE